MGTSRYNKKGVPILPIKEKIASLEFCMKHEAWEDAAGHLADLFAYCAERIVSSTTGEPMTTSEAFETYTGDATCIVGDHPLIQLAQIVQEEEIEDED